MSDRKNTPDILATLLNGSAVSEAPAGTADPAVKPTRAAPAPTSVKPRVKRDPQPREDAKPAPLEKGWEHRIASFQEHKGWRLRFVDGQETTGWASGPKLAEYIAELEAEGWQIAAASSGEAMFGSLDKYQIFFKRRK